MAALQKLAKRIKALRKARGLTAEQLAINSDLSKTALSYIERCMKEPKLCTLESIADGLNVTLKELFNFPE
ncbi:MAG: helix-turn-helix domain-containing protein [Candidatus Margulisbacteria bacterium]|jgi:transcriptional regulator with XRE-family HTH domain|nr:helix-turn-helix domain-containing protein [Candidatus Margulisiibacteriota bacterium]